MDVKKKCKQEIIFWNSRLARGMWGEKWEFIPCPLRCPFVFLYMKVSLLIFSFAFLFSSEGFEGGMFINLTPLTGLLKSRKIA